MGKVVLSRVFDNRRVHIPKEVFETLKVEDGNLLAWELLDGREARVFKAKITRKTC